MRTRRIFEARGAAGADGMSTSGNGLTYADAGVDIDAGQCAGRADQARRASAPSRPGTMARARRVRRALRPEGGGLHGPDPRRRDRRRRHQAAHRDRHRACGHDRHRPGRHVRQRPGLPGGGAVVLPRLFRHRQAGGRSGHAHHRRASPPAAPPPAARWWAARRRRCRACITRATSTLPASPWARWSGGRTCPQGVQDGRRAARPGLGRGAFQRLFLRAQGGGAVGPWLGRARALRRRARWARRC